LGYFWLRLYRQWRFFKKKTHKQQQHFVTVCLSIVHCVCLFKLLFVFLFFLLPLVVNKDVQKVMLRVAGPHDFIHSKIEEKTGQQR